MRGKLSKSLSLLITSGITPADAGKTKVLGVQNQSLQDHPRGCGENILGNNIVGAFIGSPPRMRGKPKSVRFTLCPKGITPADAGKTELLRCRKQLNTDHPRGCGENTARLRGRGFRSGSPPRMRGKPPFFSSRYRSHGITPADAGKTL